MSYIFEVVGFKMSGFLKFFGESLIVLDEDGYILSSNGVDKSDLTGFNYIDACAELSRRGSPIAEMLLKHLTDVFTLMMAVMFPTFRLIVNQEKDFTSYLFSGSIYIVRDALLSITMKLRITIKETNRHRFQISWMI